ncbi:MAG: transglutaminase-like cysteine peptidase, partial [Rhizobiales bacterium]|nr:transglutaminase-like cysteine peptidase [Hyphomicrobiales bacterium]
LVLTVRTRDGDFVLDSLREDIVTVGAARYSWVRAQSPDNPALWSRIRVRPPVRMASVFRLRGSLAR